MLRLGLRLGFVTPEKVEERIGELTSGDVKPDGLD